MTAFSICQGEVNLKQTFENPLKRITGSRVSYVSVLLHLNLLLLLLNAQ